MNREYLKEILKNRVPNKQRLEILDYFEYSESTAKNNGLIIDSQEQTIKELRENKEISDNLMVSSQRKATKWAKEVVELREEIESLKKEVSNSFRKTCNDCSLKDEGCKAICEAENMTHCADWIKR